MAHRNFVNLPTICIVALLFGGFSLAAKTAKGDMSPSGLVATGNRSSADLVWSAVDGAVGYKVFYKAGLSAAVNDTQATTEMIDGAKARITGLADGTQYAFVVTAAFAKGDGPASAAATATTDSVSGPALQASSCLPVTPGLSSEYGFSTDGPRSAENGKKWITFQNPQPDARLFYTYIPESGGLSGTGRYFNWVQGYYFAPYRNITGETLHRGFFDLLALPDSLTPGATYKFNNNVSYFVSLAAPQDGKKDLVRISFDASANQDPAYRGAGYYLLEPGVGVYRMEFRQSAEGAAGPAGISFSYRLNKQITVPQKTVTGKVLDSSSMPIADSYVTVNSFMGIKESNYLAAKCDAGGAFTVRFFTPEDIPLPLYAGVDFDGDFIFDSKVAASFKPPLKWKDDVLDLGTITLDPAAPPKPALPCLPAEAADLATYEKLGLSRVPGPLKFPTGMDDEGVSTAGPLWIGRSEVTYELWAAVYAWARTDAGGGKRVDGGPLYIFSNKGQPGSGQNFPSTHPVTMIAWRDAVVWCNALTEYLGAKAALDCAYYADKALTIPLRSSDPAGYPYGLNPAQGSADKPFIKAGALGFRLPGNWEWELAARYKGDANGDGDILDPGEFYPGSYASGATGPMMTDREATNAVAVSSFNSGLRTAPVRSKAPNALGLYDMNGNVWEYCIDNAPSDEAKRIIRGQCWGSSPDYASSGFQLANWSYCSTYGADTTSGFRVARTIAP